MSTPPLPTRQTKIACSSAVLGAGLMALLIAVASTWPHEIYSWDTVMSLIIVAVFAAWNLMRDRSDKQRHGELVDLIERHAIAHEAERMLNDGLGREDS